MFIDFTYVKSSKNLFFNINDTEKNTKSILFKFDITYKFEKSTITLISLGNMNQWLNTKLDSLKITSIFDNYQRKKIASNYYTNNI